ncbi:hypothetical protein TTHERM_001090199 (macronuclear) [Tetrahymena thermophila SB210]|uniref:Transmembrane protein n=1 Tax=Tetrahymena thermophila (strain SB210) TaxID=312017 RepID=W7XHK7_TETTS|nr:hypothetical protein TTHERM_001090199 [Tetrahymena thermophila SB210]EWS72599.1 hypothetical protein TTHERM_001090199 [Tetrahymena thermophila SB210]|eukprot:XP_012654882.1 hypothetical protein TTHERM_001090199 [Tetrahymena thermophila SB210]
MQPNMLSLFQIAIIAFNLALAEHMKTKKWIAFPALLNFAQSAHLLNVINANLGYSVIPEDQVTQSFNFLKIHYIFFTPVSRKDAF